jgi:hypothetical protein
MFFLIGSLVLANVVTACVGIVPIVCNITESVAGRRARIILEISIKSIVTKYYRLTGYYGSIHQVLARDGDLVKDITSEVAKMEPTLGFFKTDAKYIYTSLGIPGKSDIEIRGISIQGNEYCFIINNTSSIYLPLRYNYSPYSTKVINAIVTFHGKEYDATKICIKWSTCGFPIESSIEYITRDFLKENDDIVLASMEASPLDLFKFKILYSDLSEDTLNHYECRDNLKIKTSSNIYIK